MADSRRWQTRPQVARQDQFVRPPSFVDGHDSAHLESASASWHGPETRRHVAVAAALMVVAGAAAVALMLLVSTGSQAPGAAGPSAVQSDPAGLDVDPDVAVPPIPDRTGNSTSSGPISLPPVPPLPP